MSFTQVVKFWIKGAKQDFDVAKGLFTLKHYAHCLFFCHLTLEKFLKALYVHKSGKHAPYIHDLIVLAKKAQVELSKKDIDALETITSFNIQGRYGDFKSKFYMYFNNQKCAKKYLEITKNFLKCLEKELTKR